MRPSKAPDAEMRAAFASGMTRKQVAEKFGISMQLLWRRLSFVASSGREMPGDGALRERWDMETRAKMSDGHSLLDRGGPRCKTCHLLEPHVCVRRTV